MLTKLTVTGIQHWHLARLLLTVFDPTVPRLGPGRKAAVARREVSDVQLRVQLSLIANYSRPRSSTMSSVFVG